MMSEQYKNIIEESSQNELQETCIDSPGACLSGKRQDLGWSIQQVSDQIKLSPRQILAIESDDYAALPSMVVMRGFIRTYAKCLKMDVTPLLAMIKLKDVPKLDAPLLRRAIPMNFSESRFPLMGKRNGILSKWSVGIVFLILLLMSALLAQKMQWLPDLSKMMVASPVNRDVLMPWEISILPKNDVKALSPQVGKADSATTAVLTTVPITAVKETADAPVIADPAALIAVGEKNQLVLQAHEDSWIEIKRADKSTAVSRILKTGEVEKFEINEPVLLTIGNVAGVDVTLRGAALNAKTGVNGNVARINLK